MTGYYSYRKNNIFRKSELLLNADCENIEECEDLYYDLEDLQYNCDDVFRLKEQRLKSEPKSNYEEKSGPKSNYEEKNGSKSNYEEKGGESKIQEYQRNKTICNDLLIKRNETYDKLRTFKGGTKSKKKNKKKKKKQRKRKTLKNK